MVGGVEEGRSDGFTLMVFPPRSIIDILVTYETHKW